MTTDITPNSVVRVTNHGATTFKAGWNSDTWLIPPGESKFVPWFAACSWFGDPNAVNVGNHDADRHTQYRTHTVDRLSTLYGTYGAQWTADEPYTHLDYMDARDETNRVYVQRPDGKYYHPNLPFVSVEDAAGNEVRVVLNDPEGTTVTPATATTLAESRAIESQLAEMQRRMAEMQLELSRTRAPMAADPAFEGDIGDVVDGPVVSPEPRDADPAPGAPRVDGPRRGPGRPRKP